MLILSAEEVLETLDTEEKSAGAEHLIKLLLTISGKYGSLVVVCTSLMNGKICFHSIEDVLDHQLLRGFCFRILGFSLHYLLFRFG